MNDECSLSFYNIKEGSQIYLENLTETRSENEVTIIIMKQFVIVNHGDLDEA